MVIPAFFVFYVQGTSAHLHYRKILCNFSNICGEKLDRWQRLVGDFGEVLNGQTSVGAEQFYNSRCSVLFFFKATNCK